MINSNYSVDKVVTASDKDTTASNLGMITVKPIVQRASLTPQLAAQKPSQASNLHAQARVDLNQPVLDYTDLLSTGAMLSHNAYDQHKTMMLEKLEGQHQFMTADEVNPGAMTTKSTLVTGASQFDNFSEVDLTVETLDDRNKNKLA